MKIKNLLTYATLGAAYIAGSAGTNYARAETPITPEQQAKVERAMQERYGDKPKYEETTPAENPSHQTRGDPSTILFGLAGFLFYDKFMKEKRK